MMNLTRTTSNINVERIETKRSFLSFNILTVLSGTYFATSDVVQTMNSIKTFSKKDNKGPH